MSEYCLLAYCKFHFLLINRFSLNVVRLKEKLSFEHFVDTMGVSGVIYNQQLTKKSITHSLSRFSSQKCLTSIAFDSFVQRYYLSKAYFLMSLT